jgi:hypothetical protein
MSAEVVPPFETIPRFSSIPFLRHGFGTAGLKTKDLRNGKEWQGFRLVFPKQIHSDTIQFLDRAPDSRPVGDALMTRLPHLLLMIRTADCLPVIMVDPSRRAIAAVHCGWRGTAKRLLEHVVQGFEERYQCRAADLLVAFGPCIGRDCYEVGEDVREIFVREGYPSSVFQSKDGAGPKFLLDLRAANRWLLQGRGVPGANIFEVTTCTHCHKDYYSYRRDKQTKERLLSFIGWSRTPPRTPSC